MSLPIGDDEQMISFGQDLILPEEQASALIQQLGRQQYLRLLAMATLDNMEALRSYAGLKHAQAEAIAQKLASSSPTASDEAYVDVLKLAYRHASFGAVSDTYEALLADFESARNTDFASRGDGRRRIDAFAADVVSHLTFGRVKREALLKVRRIKMSKGVASGILIVVALAVLVFFVGHSFGERQTVVVTATPDVRATFSVAVDATVNARSRGVAVTTATTAQDSPVSTPSVIPPAPQQSSATQPPSLLAMPPVQSAASQLPTAVPRARELQRNDSVFVHRNTVVSGDVIVNGIQLWANNDGVGLVVILDADATITAPYGASIIAMPDSASALTTALSNAQLMQTNGCMDGKGCATVRIVRFPSRETITSPATITASTPVSQSPLPAATSPQIQPFDHDLGVCPNCTPPLSIGQHQVVLVHGDIDMTGVCHYRVYQAGQTVPSLGTGQYRIKLIQGAPEYIAAEVKSDAAGAAASASTSTCTPL